MIKMKKKKVKIILRLEKAGKYLEKQIPRRIICGLFDLQFMISDKTWKILKLNHLNKDILDFFDIVGHFDTGMHEEVVHIWDSKTKKTTPRKMKSTDYVYGKPRWKKMTSKKTPPS